MSDNFISVEKMAIITGIKVKNVEILLTKVNNTEQIDDDCIKLNELPKDILDKIVCNYKNLFPSKYILREWVNTAHLDWQMLSENPCAIELLKAYPNRIHWKELNVNSNAIELLKKNPHKIK